MRRVLIGLLLSLSSSPAFLEVIYVDIDPEEENQAELVMPRTIGKLFAHSTLREASPDVRSSWMKSGPLKEEVNCLRATVCLFSRLKYFPLHAQSTLRCFRFPSRGDILPPISVGQYPPENDSNPH